VEDRRRSFIFLDSCVPATCLAHCFSLSNLLLCSAGMSGHYFLGELGFHIGQNFLDGFGVSHEIR
jgi:hypothetical protein